MTSRCGSSGRARAAARRGQSPFGSFDGRERLMAAGGYLSLLYNNYFRHQSLEWVESI